MNPLIVETALQSALAASAFPSIQIYLGTSYLEMSPESLNLIVSVDQLEHIASNLYKAHTSIKITSPALLGSGQLSTLVSTLETLRANFTADYFTTHWTSSDVTFNGLWVQETSMTQHEHEWVADLKAVIGVTE